jgi:hypothetical protein
LGFLILVVVLFFPSSLTRGKAKALVFDSAFSANSGHYYGTHSRSCLYIDESVFKLISKVGDASELQL